MSKKRHTRANGLIGELRARVATKLDVCPACGQGVGGSQRTAARAMRVSSASLSRFLAGKDPSARTIERAMKWLGVGWTK
jgi:hypothetical protein